MLKKLTLLTLSSVAAFAMHTAEININDSDLELGAKLDMGQFYDTVEPDTVFVGFKFLNADDKHSENDKAGIKPYYEVNFLMQRDIGDKGMSIGLGMKLNYTKAAKSDFMSIPLGAEFGYKIPASDLIPMSVHGSLYYAPSVLSFSDADSFLEYRLSYDIEVIPNGNITLGYRRIDTNYEAADFKYNSSWFAGFKFGF